MNRVFHFFKGTGEIFKFGIYLMFPVGSLFLFNTPGVLDYFKTPGMDKIKEAIEEEKRGLYRIPKSLDEIEDQLELIKKANLEKRNNS